MNSGSPDQKGVLNAESTHFWAPPLPPRGPVGFQPPPPPPRPELKLNARVARTDFFGFSSSHESIDRACGGWGEIVIAIGQIPAISGESDTDCVMHSCFLFNVREVVVFFQY